MLLLIPVALGALFLLSWFIPVRLDVEFRQEAWHADLALQVRAPLVRLGKKINITEDISIALDHVLTRWKATGEPVKVPLQKTVRRLPRKKLLRVLSRPLRYLGRRIRCSRVAVAAEVGGWDAMQSALLAGAWWAVVGNLLAGMSRRLRLEPGAPSIRIEPNFSGPAWRVHASCILHLKLGHAIVAGIWLLRRALREKELVAWARDSWRRKGEEGSGRASDPGPDEDGHGEP